MDEEEAEAVSPQLKAVNKNLADYNTEWDQFVDCWLVLRVSMPSGRAVLHSGHARPDCTVGMHGQPVIACRHMSPFMCTAAVPEPRL